MENLDDFTPMTEAELQLLNKKKISPKAVTRIIICAVIMLPITIAILFLCESASDIGWYGYGGMCANGLFIWLPLIFWWGKFVFGGTLWDPDTQVKRVHPDGREEHGIKHGKRTGPIAGFLQGLGLFIVLRIVFELIKYLLFS